MIEQLIAHLSSEATKSATHRLEELGVTVTPEGATRLEEQIADHLQLTLT